MAARPARLESTWQADPAARCGVPRCRPYRPPRSARAPTTDTRRSGMSRRWGEPGGTLAGSVLSPVQAAAVRRDAQNVLTRVRSELAAGSLGRLDSSRAYSQGDVDLWFAASAFADNAAIYEQLVSNSANREAAVL